jgi:serine/threonine-protein kinase
MDSRSLVIQMQQLGLLPQDEAARRTIQALCREHPAEVRDFARELLKKHILTAFQANLLLTGKGQQLLVGPYIIQERLGEGGMGQVFKVQHRKLGRTLALKVIRPERASNPVAVSRFFREVQVAGQLAHPHIVRAYDAGQIDKTYYFAMEFVSGTDLAAHVKHHGPLPIKQACRFLLQAAEGMQHIHEHGLVHRDIKPNNLILAYDRAPTAAANGGGVAMRTVPATLKILDLGLARLAVDEDDSRKSLTREGAVMGTVDYMAPEQARDSRDADIRSDIYSLGCTFYFALTGQVPFPGGTSFEKMLHHQLDEPAPLEQFRPDLPAGLSAIVRRMMAKDPVQRFQQPAEVAAAVAQLDDSPAEPPLAIPVAEEAPVTIDIASEETDEPLMIVDKTRLSYRRTSPWLLLLGWALGLGLVFAALVLFTILWVLKR